ncbi:hypothetical protein GSY74_04600 [Sulfurovum sp. bin170]|uniref:hypothetical protein n=1 Tax=Sulfurovum sp. bin170 TaxID=2695268 RepID=UPI0013E04A54|nr:hypothetical protein [Sulfurovum sp. bin170]NEW60555.1 hypothetical protein [Sulfurovum sp. bin170]
MKKRSLVTVVSMGLLVFGLSGCVAGLGDKLSSLTGNETGKEDIGETSDGKSESSIMTGAGIGAAASIVSGGDAKAVAQGAVIGGAVGAVADAVNQNEAGGEKGKADTESANQDTRDTNIATRDTNIEETDRTNAQTDKIQSDIDSAK